MAEAHEFTGKSVEEAINQGLLSLHTTREQVEIEVVSQGSRGIFGLGGEPARIRLTKRAAPSEPAQPIQPTTATEASGTAAAPAPSSAARAEAAPPTASVPDEAATAKPSAENPTKSTPSAESTGRAERDATRRSAKRTTSATVSPPSAEAAPQPSRQPSQQVEKQTNEEQASEVSEAELAALATDLLKEIVELMQFTDASVEARWQEPEDDFDERYLMLNVEGDDEELASLIGRRSETLNALQYLLRLMINQRTRQWQNIVVDVNGYKDRRANQLSQLAIRMAEQAVATGRAQSLEPMPANERRIVHLVLRDYAGVYTESSGEGERRKVHIVPEQ